MKKSTPTKKSVKRRRYSKSFKARIVTACDQPDASVAHVALTHGLNTSLVHKWRRSAQSSAPVLSGKPDFLPIAIPDHSTASSEHRVTFEVASIKVHWPLEHIERAIVWLRTFNA